MSHLSYVYILDQTGLDPAIIEKSILSRADGFIYRGPEAIEETLRLLSENPAGSFACLFLTDIPQLQQSISIPKNLVKKSSFAVILSPGETMGLDDGYELLDSEDVIDILEAPISVTGLNILLRRTQLHLRKKAGMEAIHQQLVQQRDELMMLNEIGMALSSERDIARLLELILAISMDLTKADAGSLYIVEEIPGVPYSKVNYFRGKQLRYKHTKNNSKEVPFKEYTMPISPRSIAGYAALSGQPLNIPDVYRIPVDVPYEWGGLDYDEKTGYHTISMLVVPMLNRDKETIGIIQLINKKRDSEARIENDEMALRHVIPFELTDENFIYSMASQAAVAYESQRLYHSVRALLDGFIQASMTAIEARDPTTSGHSERVAVLTVGLAEALDLVDSGPYRAVSFSRQEIQEIRYAALLHDFGKIGVRESVLVKAKKLYDYERQAIESRYNILRKAIELDASRKKTEYLLQKSRDEALPFVSQLDRDTVEKIAELDDILQFILKANEPTVLRSEGFERLKEIKSRFFAFGENEIYPYLTEAEARRLMIPKGSLDDEERLQIESHVSYTFSILKHIPWTNDLRNVPEIAYAHHEKIDGSGYPLRRPIADIPVQAKMMAITDIFDALTAHDRPYKKAVPLDKALDILGYEVKDGKLDRDLFQIFCEAKIYDLVLGKSN
jgi:HD-GYP domain-containing protein (c-di-GMP phosphodiesterase class II)